MAMAFKPNGIEFNGVLLRSDTAAGNLNFYKGMEGFLESFPQAIYQFSILIRLITWRKPKPSHRFSYLFGYQILLIKMSPNLKKI